MKRVKILLVSFLTVFSCSSLIAEFPVDSLHDNTISEAKESNLDSIENHLKRVYLNDGSELVGRIEEETNNSIQFKTINGITLVIDKEFIEKTEVINGEMVKGKFWRYDPNQTRMFFAPTGRALKAGEGYFSVYQIFLPFVAIGITDYLSIAGGTCIIPGLFGDLNFFNLKVTPFEVDEAAVSLGYFTGGLMSEDVISFSILYACSTIGNNHNNFTIGLGNAFGEEFSDGSITLVLGGELRVSNNIKLISENWFISNVNLLTFGLRFFGTNLAGDFGLMTTSESNGNFIPWLGLTYNW